MKRVLPICALLALSTTAYAQQPAAGPRVLPCVPSQTDARPDPAGKPQQVLVNLQLIEVSLTKLRESGFDMKKLPCHLNTQPDRGPGFIDFIDDSSPARQTFESLRKDHFAKVITESRLLASNGQMVNFSTADRLPLGKTSKDRSAVAYPETGTRIKLVPYVLTDESVRLELQVGVSELAQGEKMHAGTDTAPTVHTLEMTTNVKIRSGTTFAFGGHVGQHPRGEASPKGMEGKGDERAMFLLVRAEIVPPGATAASVQDAAPAPRTISPGNAPVSPVAAKVRRPATDEICR
jgi:hypothetical protein